MSKDELQAVLSNATVLERDVLDRVASGFSSGMVTAYRIACELNIVVESAESTLEKFQLLGLIALDTRQGWYLSSRISEFFEVRAASFS